MYITRKLEDTILQYLESPEIIAVVGPRQSGKTTMLQHVFETIKDSAIFLTFEDKKTLDLFVYDTDAFIEAYIKPNKYIFIDEFQYAKKGGKILKYIIDTAPRKIFISGSSSIDLTVQAVKYLVGRIFVFSLFPLDFEEYLRFKNPHIFELYKNARFHLENYSSYNASISEMVTGEIKKHYEEYTIYGGYPRVAISSTDAERKTVLKNIYNTYFLREVKDILGLADDYKLSQMIKSLALQVGSLVQYREIGDVSELSYQTVKLYLNFLEKTFIALLIKPYFKNKRTEIVKNPKVYFFDTGLRNYIVDDFRGIDERTDSGALLENALAMQILKQELTFKFWRTKQKSEVDFIVSLSNHKNIAIEVKKKIATSDFTSRSVKEFKARHSDIPLIFSVYTMPVKMTQKDIIFIGLI